MRTCKGCCWWGSARFRRGGGLWWWVVVLIAAFSLVRPVNAADYYLDPVSGNDGNSGTSSGAPKKTLAASVSQMNNNLNILVFTLVRAYMCEPTMPYSAALVFCVCDSCQIDTAQ